MTEVKLSGKYIDIIQEPRKPRRKTDTYEVRTKTGDCLGWVKWFGRWRKYSFFPAYGTAFEQTCLRDISDFMEAATKSHKSLLQELKDLNLLMSGMFK